VSAFEQHFTVGELAKTWRLHADTVRPWFRDEPDCLVEHHPETLHKRGYTSIRVPRSVAERVYRRHCSK
jgi:hypothetical protein